jgi:5'-methylthioadenosine phosphorylase
MNANVAIIGGSGVYALDLLKNPKTAMIDTPFGISPEIVIGNLGGVKLAFLPRHGERHTVPPHLINYRANIWAIKELGVTRVLATTAVGSMNPRMHLGDIALLDQFIDFTKCRPTTFYEGGKDGVVHVDVAQPYCPELRAMLIKTASTLKIKLHPRGVYCCFEGPRFETAAEIESARRMGGDLAGMSIVPECVLAREAGICYSAIAVVTNLAAGISKSKLTHAEVIKLMAKNMEQVKKLMLATIPKIPAVRGCACGKALDGARVKV